MSEKAKKTDKKPSILVVMAAKYNLDSQMFLDTIKKTVMRPGRDGRVASNEEIAAFLVVANKYNLDPFTNEIYAFPSKKGGIVPVVGVDGFVSLMNRNPGFDGMEIEFSETDQTMDGAKSCPEWCEIKIYRKGIAKPIVVREYLDEVYCGPKGGYPGPWQTHTKRMLRHKAIIQCARVAFGITGIYDPDEADRIIEAEVTNGPALKPAVEMPKAIADESGQESPIPKEGEQVQGKSNLPQQKAIHILGGKLKRDVKKAMGEEYGLTSTKELSFVQATELIEKWSKEVGGSLNGGQDTP